MSSVADKPERPKERVKTAPNRTAIVIIIIVGILGAIFGRYNQAARAEREEYFMGNEIVLVGTEENINVLIDELQEDYPNIVLTIDQDRSFDLQTLPEPTQESLGPQTVASASLQIGSNTPACNQLNRKLQINLYELTGSVDDVEAVLAAIDNTTAGDNVFSEANWVIGAPWSPTGSPWSPTGSPWSPTGSANQGAPTPATSDDYANQWAFNTIDLARAKEVSSDANDPQNVWVGVFDTSPMKATDGSDIETVPPQKPADNALRVEIAEPDFVNTPVPPKPGSREDIDVANHGYFGTSFIRELAPGSQIKIIPVLTRNNRGDLATLNKQLLTFMADVNTTSISGTEKIRAVVNLSLGVPPLEPFKPFAPLLQWEFPPPFELERQLNSLEIVSQIGECLDIVMVAAAGNDSSESLKVANYPASWGNVLSVTASNKANEQSCFANEGEVAAPGGDGGPSEPEAKDPIACEPKLHLCSGPDCEYSIIGYVHPQTLGPQESGVTHQHWVGTSFAAPMVTGLAALLRQLDDNMSAAQVREAIMCGSGTIEPITPQSVRVINVRRTLECAGLPEG